MSSRNILTACNFLLFKPIWDMQRPYTSCMGLLDKHRTWSCTRCLKLYLDTVHLRVVTIGTVKPLLVFSGPVLTRAASVYARKWQDLNILLPRLSNPVRVARRDVLKTTKLWMFTFIEGISFLSSWPCSEPIFSLYPSSLHLWVHLPLPRPVKKPVRSRRSITVRVLVFESLPIAQLRRFVGANGVVRMARYKILDLCSSR